MISMTDKQMREPCVRDMRKTLNALMDNLYYRQAGGEDDAGWARHRELVARFAEMLGGSDGEAQVTTLHDIAQLVKSAQDQSLPVPGRVRMYEQGDLTISHVSMGPAPECKACESPMVRSGDHMWVCEMDACESCALPVEVHGVYPICLSSNKVDG